MTLWATGKPIWILIRYLSVTLPYLDGKVVYLPHVLLLVCMKTTKTTYGMHST